VEAPTGFSIFLSGFLVKSALYGFYKLSNFLGTDINTYFFSTFVFISVVDASLKMWGQSDLKKLVAYGTIQEMNLIYLTFCWGDSLAVYGGFLFCITHAFLSALFFYFVDCIYRRYKSRSVVEINGLLHINPLLGIAIFVGCVCYAGLPGTLKFLCEFYIFSGLLETSPAALLVLIYSANFFGIIGFSKCWFNSLFGMSSKLQNIQAVDLTTRENLIIWCCFFLLIALNLYLPWWF
jgi:NADH:ubiquinone oxidoreductase subunit 4 (subunit M)